MVKLLIINRDFPTIGSQLPHQHSKVVANLNEKDQSKLKSHEVTCSCPTRSKVPDKPRKLPFKASSENISKMREWLLQRYAASTFNICPHKPLNQMSGPHSKFIWRIMLNLVLFILQHTYQLIGKTG